MSETEGERLWGRRSRWRGFFWTFVTRLKQSEEDVGW